MGKKKFSFDKVSKKMDKLSKYGGMIDEINYSEITEWIDTGNYALNASISGSIFKGIPNNRIIGFAGSEGTGKTFIMLNVVKKAQEMGYYVVYFDTENAVDKDTLNNFKIDRSGFRYEPVATVEQLRTLTTNILEIVEEAIDDGYETDKIIFVLDSLGNLASNKEIDDASDGNNKADFTRAKMIKSLFRIITLKLANVKIPFIFTNHTYAAMDLYSDDTPSGGTGAKYNPSVLMLTSKKKHPNDKKISKKEKDKGIKKSGIIVKMKPYKNRFARPIIIEFYIDFTKGMNPYVGLERYVSWDACGIEYGGKIDKDGNLVKSQNGRFAVKHLGKTVTAKNLFTPEVFTPEVLAQLQENAIGPLFSFPDGTDAEDFYEDLTHDDDDLQEALDEIRDEDDLED